uniref:dynein heavy chain domain-containing protein 1 n=1 Tax=Solea senegalensis TaxID=28829 RepID=UPI001CD8E302|nr:dynein heavy chain domain-containing protein 1 [Solea senegalensis]
MFAASSEERSRDQTCGHKVNKKAKSPEVSLPPLCPKPPALSPFGRTPVLHDVSSHRQSSSVVGLPRLLISHAGPRRARGDTEWTEKPRLKASARGTEIPFRSSAEVTPQRENEDLIKATTSEDQKINRGRATRLNKSALTGTDVLQLFAQRRHQAEFYLLKQEDGDCHRPYHLHVVDSSEAGAEHYIFSPHSVLHVTETGYGGLVSLTEWHREAVLWTALQKKPFFKDFRRRKAFTRWHRNVRKVLFQRRRESLQDTLLFAVPQFRRSLHVFTRLIEDLKETHWLPQEEAQTYTLVEFKNALTTKSQECLHILEKLSKYRTVILNGVKQICYKEHQELQQHVEYAKKPNKRHEPIHVHLAHQQELKRQLARSERVLHKLGNFGSLVNRMIVQSVATVVRRDVCGFLSNVLKRKKSQQCSLFHTELCLSAECLTVDPPVYLFRETLSEALLTVGDSIIQMCESCGFFLEISSNTMSCDVAQDLMSDLSCVELPIIPGQSKSRGGSCVCGKFCCWQMLRDLSAQWLLLLPKRSLLMTQGNMVRGCYSPLSKTQLEWQIGSSDRSGHVEREQVKIMKEVEVEIQQLCDDYTWLLDIQLFLSEWSPASLKGHSALQYEEHIKRIRNWAERINSLPSSVSTSNQLFMIHCTHTKETLGQQLSFIEKDTLKQLVEQTELHSTSLISDLEKTAAELKTDPKDLFDLSTYASQVRESLATLTDRQRRLEHIRSLKLIISTNYRQMNEQELNLEQKMLGLWDCFIPFLKEADGIVRQSLPSATNAVDKMVSFTVRDLKHVVSTATSGPFLEPAQNAKEMVSKLNTMCRHVHTLHAKLEQLNTNRINLQECAVDATHLTADIQKVTARKELWELMVMCTKWMEEWKQQLFCEVVVSDAQEKIAKWREQALALTRIIPTHDAVLQEAVGKLKSLSHQLAVMSKLQSPTLRHKHWRAIFEGLGLVYIPEKKLTVAELMSQPLEVHQKLIMKICTDAQTESKLEQTFKKLQHKWETRLFELVKSTHPLWQPLKLQPELTDAVKPTEPTDSKLQSACQHSVNDARFTITGLQTHFAELEDDLMTLASMLKSPRCPEFRQQMEEWVQSLQDLEKLLDLFDRYQQTWTFLSTTLNETFFTVQRSDLLEQFKPADGTFQEIMRTISGNPHVLNFVRSTKTSLCQKLSNGLSTMEAISNQMVDVLDVLREQFPRLWFLSDREVIQLLSCHPEPSTLQPFVRKCFKGVNSLEVGVEIQSNTRQVNTSEATTGDQRPMKVLGVFASLREHITFLSPVEQNRNALVWLSTFEKQLKLTMAHLVNQYAVVSNQLQPTSQDLPRDVKIGDNTDGNTKNIELVLDLLSQYPLQCVLVAEEAVWCTVVQEAFQEPSPVKLNILKACNSEKLKNLCRYVKESLAQSESLISTYMIVCLGALVQLTMNHGQQLSQLMDIRCDLVTSFEWLSLMKYYISSKAQSQKGDVKSGCYVDVFGHHFQYGYEYSGPEDWAMVQTPATDRAKLGILLAMKSHRCGFVSGPCMSGKTKTVVQLGKALGRQVVIVQCSPSMRPGVIQQMLFGALQTGAWLLLDSVDSLTQGSLSLLGQHLLDIHQSFSTLTGHRNKSMTVDEVIAYTNIDLAGKSISVNPNYGCVLVSSRGYTSDLPESLRFASRPVALTHPDYRIIAEVMLTSIGFSDAMSLSLRLVSLISLSKDSLFLPDFITKYQSCYLVVLQKIVSTSELYFKQSLRQQETLNEGKRSATEKNDLMSSQNVTVEPEKGHHKSELPSRLHSSNINIKQSLMEETALVKAILSVLLPVLYDHKKASQFYMIFKDSFPIASQVPFSQHNFEEEQRDQLKDAITGELQRKGFHPDSETICNTLTLYQTMKYSQAVLLVGPSGSGKTTCYRSLAGALNSLAAKETEYMFEGDPPRVDLQVCSSNWNSVDTVVLFPNAMCHNEVFGFFCGKRGWQDGAVPKVLRYSERLEHTSSNVCNTEKKNPHKPAVKWLVMDGEPVGKPGWLDYLTTLCDCKDPFLFLPSGEKLAPSQKYLKVLMEITDLSDASPSAVTRCSLVHFTGTDMWKAVWKKEFDALSCDYRLDQGTTKMWNHLAKDLFSSTLSLLRENALTSVIHRKGQCFTSPMYGLFEMMSFVRILYALLHHFGNEAENAEATQRDKRDVSLHGTRIPGIDSKLLTRNIFLLAYVWGFGGHLHPCDWPQFDLLVRQVLFSCRYKIMVPDDESVFEHFFSIDSKMFPNSTLSTISITPKYGNYTYLLNLMLEANQPVLLAGEPCSGKTTLCRSLLSFDKPHISLPASPLLSSRDLRIILSNKDTVGSVTKRPRLLLFVDDLHEAPCDAFGTTSTALESLRQSISMGAILTFDNDHLVLLDSGHISYMATCCVSGLGNHHSNVVSTRLSHLFSIFVLPVRSMDVILSINSSRLQVWLKQMPLQQSGEDMARCIITATGTLYHTVCDQFQPTVQRPCFKFSHHDMQKVLQGMYLWEPVIQTTGTLQAEDYARIGFPQVLPESTASVLNIAHLWMHECMRTFGDRLCSEDESASLVSLIARVATANFGFKLVGERHPDSTPAVTDLAIHSLPTDTADSCKQTHHSPGTLPSGLKSAGQSEIKKDFTMVEPSLSQARSSEDSNLQPEILQYMMSIMATLVYGPEFPKALDPIDQQTNFKLNSYYKEQYLDAVLQKLSLLMDSNEDGKGRDVANYNKIASRFIMHRERVSQLLHILRVLLIPGGHGVLLSSQRGTGRKTTVRFAAYLSGYDVMEVHAGNENNLHEMLKKAGNHTRVEGGNVIILVHEEVSESVREELLLSMAHRIYPALHTEEELNDLVSRATTAKTSSRKYQMDNWMLDKFLSQVHRNVHVFLLMSSTTSEAGDGTQVMNRQLTKALRLCCCVEVYRPWSSRSLTEVAVQCLKTSPHIILKAETLVAGVSAAMAGIHRSACQYASVLLKAQNFSPQAYMEFIAHFDFLCNHLHIHCQGKADRITSVLSVLDVLNDAALQNRRRVERLKEAVAEKQQCENALLRELDEQKIILEEAQKKCAMEEKNLHDLEEEISRIQKQVRPVFLSGLNILKCLNPSDLEEIRRYRDPPDGVVTVMDAVCLLFDRPPGWENAKQLLGQSNFFQELEFFDRFTLTNEQLQQLGLIVHSPHFVPECVRDVSKACESLCRWVQTVYECCRVQHRLLVKHRLEGLDREARGRLYLAKQSEEGAQRRLEEFKLRLRLVREDLDELLLELHKAEEMKREATSTAEQLEAHVRDWKAAAQEGEIHSQNLPGDALILAAIIAYLGPFAHNIRTELLSKWTELCQTGSINTNPEDSRTSLFTRPDPASPLLPLGFPIPVSERLPLRLGPVLGLKDWQLHNTVSVKLVVQLLLWGCRNIPAQRWPLLADARQHQEIRSQSWLIAGDSVELGSDYGMTVCADDPDLLDKLDEAAQKGLRVLVTHVERATPSCQFLATLAPPAGCGLNGLEQHVQTTHPEFRLILSTDVPARLLRSVIHPAVLARARVVDLSASVEDIQELMLTQLLQSECKELLIKHTRLQNDKHVLQEELVREQEALMDYVLRSNPSLPQLSDLRSHVDVFQEAMTKLQFEIQQVSEELQYHEALVADLRHLATLAAALYRVLQDVSRLSPAYHFSLSGFLKVLRDAFIVKGRPLVSYITRRVPAGIVPEVTNNMVSQLLVQYKPRVFESHFAVLKLLVFVAVLHHNQLCSEGERVAFIRGFQDMEQSVLKVKRAAQSTASLPSWIPTHVHPELLWLENIPAFRGLISSLSKSPIQWREYLRFPSSTVVGAVPCRSHSHLSLLQRALLWKTLLPHCLEEVADVIASCHLCLTAASEAPHTGNPESLSRFLAKHEGPILLTLPSPGGDTWTSIQPLHLINTLADCGAEHGGKQQVKFVSVGALRDRELVLSVLERAVSDGHWLVFNCPLIEQWDDKVVAQLTQIISPSKGEPCHIHPRFRLWFITREHEIHHVPATVRVHALALVCDSPGDLKEELSRSVQHVLSITRCGSRPQSVTADSAEFLLRCAVFHSVLLQRQTCGLLGRRRICSWNQDDLAALVDAHDYIISLCHEKTKALQYIAVGLVHGGHVLDSADVEEVENTAETCLRRESPLWSGGRHVLSGIVDNSGEFDSSRLLQIMEPGLQDSASAGDPLALGFGVDTAAEMIRVRSHNLNVLLQASQTPPGVSRPPVAPAHGHAGDRLRALKSSLTDKDSTVTDAGRVHPGPLRDFLQQEWEELTDTVSSLLLQLQHDTPKLTSPLSLTHLCRLEKKAELLGAYVGHGGASDPPGAYRLCAFNNPRGFLVAVMRQAAREKRKYISDIKLHFQVVSDSSHPASPRLDAVYLCGLELRGASWDAELGALQDTVSPQPRTLPPVCVTAQVRSRKTKYRDTFPCKSSYLMDTNNVQVSHAPPSTASQLPVYLCPVVLHEERETGDWRLADVNVITQVPLHARLSPVLCSLRRVRLVSMLKANVCREDETNR